jgi:hypothetical protein
MVWAYNVLIDKERIKVVLPDMFDPVRSIDLPFVSIEFGTQFWTNGWYRSLIPIPS